MYLENLITVDQDSKPSCNNSCLSEVFETKEEFITHLIRTKQIKKDHRKYSDNRIHLIGTLKIDSRVKKGLNWNDVVVSAAIVEKGMINKYKYLPLTTKGVTNTLEIPSLELYMFHNNFNAICKKGEYFVDMFRIPSNAGNLNFSSVRANLALFYGKSIELSKLPQAKNILGLSYKHLIVDCPNAYKIAKNKGCNEEILEILRPQNPIIACFSGFIKHDHKI